MNDLIQINQTQINGVEVNSINARNIHEYLEVKTKFADWIKRAIEKYDFIVDEDFAILKNGNGNNSFIDYIVTMDMAKELSMLENNPKGKETRKFFIEAEKKSQIVLSIPQQIKLIAQGNQIIDERLTTLENTKRLENWQERSLQVTKNKKVYELLAELKTENKTTIRKLHSRVWGLFKKRFNLPRYNELPAIMFKDGEEFINMLTLECLLVD